MQKIMKAQQCLLTNWSSSTSTVEGEGRRVGPGTSGGLTDTDPVRTRSKVVQRIHLASCVK